MNSADVIQDMMMVRPNKPKIKPLDAVIMPEASKLEAFFTTERAKSYHKRDCFALRNAESLIEMTKEEMGASGRKACANCISAP